MRNFARYVERDLNKSSKLNRSINKYTKMSIIKFRAFNTNINKNIDDKEIIAH